MNTQRVEGHTPTPWQSYWRTDDKDRADCGIFSEVRKGQAYSVCRSPKYQTKEQWEADSAFILHAVNNIERLEKVNEALVLAINTHLYFLAGRPNFDCFNGPDRAAYEALLSISRLAKEPA